MDRGRIRQRELIQFSEGILYTPAVKVDVEDAFFEINLGDAPDIAVEDLFLVVVDLLQHFVPGRIVPAKTLQLRGSGGIEPLLQCAIEGAGSHDAAVGRG